MQTVAEHLIAGAFRPMTILSRACAIGTSIGIAYHDGGDHAQMPNGDVLLNHADMVMYATKHDSGNTWRMYVATESQADPKAEKPERKTG